MCSYNEFLKSFGLIIGNSQDRYDAEVADGTREKETKATAPVQRKRVNRCEDHRRQKFSHSQSQL